MWAIYQFKSKLIKRQSRYDSEAENKRCKLWVFIVLILVNKSSKPIFLYSLILEVFIACSFPFAFFISWLLSATFVHQNDLKFFFSILNEEKLYKIDR